MTMNRSTPPKFARVDHAGEIQEWDSDEKNQKSNTDDYDKQDCWRVNLSSVQPRQLALRSGKFQFDDGSIGDFVFVPEHYKFDTEESFQSILNALHVTEPEIVFRFDTNYGVVPNIDYEETKRYWKLFKERNTPYTVWTDRNDLKFPHPKKDYVRIKRLETRTQNILDAMSEACSQGSAIYLLTDPFRGNKLAEMACRSAQESGHGSVHSLGLFVCDEFSTLDVNKQGPGSTFEPFQDDNADNDISSTPFVLPWNRRLDTQRVFLDRHLVFQNQDFVVTNGDVPKYAISIKCDRTESEELFLETYRHHSLPNGLASECSHRLVFETRKSKEDFETKFLKRFPTGSFIAGSDPEELHTAVENVRAGRPVFTLVHSGIAADAVAMLFRYAKRVQNKTLEDEQDKQLYLEFNFPPSVALWNQLSLGDRVWYDARVIAETFQSLIQFYNPETNRIIDLNEPQRVEELQETITWVLGCAFDSSPELGGIEKNRKAITQAAALRNLTAAAAERYRLGSRIFMLLIRGFIILAVLLTVIQSQYEEDDPAFEVLKVWNIIIPLIGSALIGLEASYRPATKFAALILTEKQIDSEIFRFRTRTGIYRNRGDIGIHRRHPRSLFTDRLQVLLDECMQSDVASGSIFRTAEEVEQFHKIYESLQGNWSADALADMYAPTFESPRTPFSSMRDNSIISSVRKKAYAVRDVYQQEKPIGKKDWFYSKDFNYRASSMVVDECKEPQHREIFYSRDCDFLPDEAFLEQEEAAYRRLAILDDIDLKKTLDGKSGNGHDGMDNDGILRGHDYVKERLRPNSAKFWAKLPRKTNTQRALVTLITCLTASATGFVSFGLHEWVPLILAISAALEYSTAYLHLDTGIPNLNAAATELTNIESWWNGLSLIQSRQLGIRDILVHRTESAIISYYTQHAGATKLLAEQRLAAATANAEDVRGNRNENTAKDGRIASRSKKD